MSGWASILSAASALLGTLAGFWATARKRAEENAEMRVQLAGLLTLTEALRQEQRRQSHEFSYQAAHPPPDDAFDALRARLLLHDLFLLADEEQALLIRHRLHGCSLTETARMEGMSVKRVRHRLKALYRAYFAQKETKQKEL